MRWPSRFALVASRHRFRIWNSPFTGKEQEVRVGAGTRDIGLAEGKRNNNLTHKIDSAVEGSANTWALACRKPAKPKP
jgi:hypothetical protein